MANVIRGKRASSIPELPGALLILFLFLAFPLADLATIALNASFLIGAVREAAHAAAQAKTFERPLSALDPSAKQIAAIQAARNERSFRAISITRVQTDIAITDIRTHAVTRRSTPLTQPADESKYMYAIEVTVTGHVNPLIKCSLPLLGRVPGLTEPIPLTPRAQEFAENTAGLNQ